MASTTKNTSLGKVKTKTPSPSPTTTTTPRTDKDKIRTPSSATERRTTRPMVSRSSSSKGLSVSSDRASPNYLKGTLSSTKVPKKQAADDTFIKKKAADDTGLKYSSTPRRQSIDKPPSPAQLKRTLSSSPKERRLTTPSPPSKKTISPKPATSKTPPTKADKNQPFRPANLIKRSASTTPRVKRESRPSSAASTPTPSSPETDENPVVVKPQGDDKVAPVKEIHIDPTEAVEQLDQVQAQSSPIHDQTSSDAIASDTSKSPVKETATEVKEEPHAEVAENTDRLNQENEQVKEEEEEVEIIKEENPTAPEESEAQEEVTVEVKEGEDDCEEKENNIDNTSPSQEMEEKASQEEEKQAEITGDKNESQNVVLKRQDTQGKRGSPAYNNVIEETASKLVQKRKGKVLALVGAFETVINLESDNQQNEAA